MAQADRKHRHLTNRPDKEQWIARMACLPVSFLLAFSTFAQCGSERWPVKTLADPEGPKIAKSHLVVQETVADLTKSGLHTKGELLKDAETRISPQEDTIYEVHARLLGFKKETDQDFHIVIADLQDPDDTMVVEIPAGSCLPKAFQKQFADLQEQFIQTFGKPTITFKRLPFPIPVDVKGIGFFDFVHGQTGVARNGFELHPVLSIEKESN